MKTGQVIDRLHAVLDINVFLSAFLSRDLQARPGILQRWLDGYFVFLVSSDLIDELVERLLKSGIQPL